MDFESSFKFYYVRSTFDLQVFRNETMVHLSIFEICTKMRFVSLTLPIATCY